MNPLAEIPAKARYVTYLVYTALIVVQGGLAIWYNDPDPEWVKKSGDVLQYLGGVLAFTAASNVTSRSTPPPAPHDNPLNPEDGDEPGRHRAD